MARNLLAKAGRVQVPPVKSETVAETVPHPGGPPAPARGSVAIKPKTAPGTLMGFMANQSEAMKENELLRTQAARFEGAEPTRLIDAARITPSRWANRHVSSFDSADFAALKEEIGRAGGNVQPIKVRPIAGGSTGGVGPSYPPGEFAYEIVFGHRRHRACLELGLPVLALIEHATEQELFVQMERENRNRADLSAWEQGVMYTRAIDHGLYASNRQLAAAIGRDVADVGKAISLARLPQAVIDAFHSPLDLQFRWAKPLNDVQQGDPEGLLKRAKSIAGKGLSAKEVLGVLTGTGQGVGRSYSPQDRIDVERGGVVVATISTSAIGQVNVKFNQKLDETRKRKLAALIKQLLD
ncbi:ParB/RepB/Spo0J family partition protein [Variovorax sp. PvP013]|uniref:ParB/RepB/Spo0J family partition protein n=1 Tax=Variovorax sp. PvP013 TaxID=3156435 RepID=UPI003D1CA18A